MPRDKTLDVRPGQLDCCSMRYHELWLQRWFYSRFFVHEGVSCPVIFATPMDAFANFKQLWASENNPFKYLLEAKDENGTPLYEPHPSPVRYPLISVMRKGIVFRPYQNFSIHNWRHINWPTISDEQEVPGTEQIGTDLTKCNLAHVTTSRMPMALNYKFQIDHFCLRPDTQAFYIERVLNQFWRSGGAVLQSWMEIEYPGWGSQYIRIFLEGAIEQVSPEEDYQNKQVEFRTTFGLIVEGFSIDVNYEIKPALWKLIFTSATPEQLAHLPEPAEIVQEIDLRPGGYNEVLESRPVIPASGTCQQEISAREWADAGTGSLGVQGVPSTVVFGNGTFVSTYLAPLIIDGGTLVDSSAQAAGFHVGSMDLWIYQDGPVQMATGFSAGTYTHRILPGGSFVDFGSHAASFYRGTYAPITVQGTAYDSGSQVSTFSDGTYLSVVMDGGTYIDSGTGAASFYEGTYVLRAILASPVETVVQSSAFYGGIYAS